MHDCEAMRRWLVFAALLPYAVHHDHRIERREAEVRRSQDRAHRLMQRIPIQRSREITLPRREVAPPGSGPWHG